MMNLNNGLEIPAFGELTGTTMGASRSGRVGTGESASLNKIRRLNSVNIGVFALRQFEGVRVVGGLQDR